MQHFGPPVQFIVYPFVSKPLPYVIFLFFFRSLIIEEDKELRKTFLLTFIHFWFRSYWPYCLFEVQR